MNGLELLKQPCLTPTKLIEQASRFCLGISNLPKRRILNALAQYPTCEHAKYWIRAVNDIA